MKRIILLIFAVLSLLSVEAQNRVISVGKSITTTHHKWTLNEIVLSKENTVCKWTVESLFADTYVQMNYGAYLETESGIRLYLTESKGLPMVPNKHVMHAKGSKINYESIFPALPANTEVVSYHSSPTFYIKDIEVGVKANIELNEKQHSFLKKIFSFLNEEKLEPQLSDNSIQFKLKEEIYEIEVSAVDNTPMRADLYLKYAVNEGVDEITLMHTAALLNLLKAANMIVYTDYIAFHEKIYVTDIESFPYLFYRSIKNIEETSKKSAEAYELSLDLNADVVRKKNINIKNPAVKVKSNSKCYIRNITANDEYTIISFQSYNKDGHEWCNINPNSSILVDGKFFKMIKAEGIAVAPRKTIYPSSDSSIEFKLYFQPIPESVNTIDFYEDNAKGWWFEGINLIE